MHTDPAGRLVRGANKTCSERHLLPLEYFSKRTSLPFARNFLSLCRKYFICREDALFTLALLLLDKCGLLGKKHVQKVLSSYPGKKVPFLARLALPEGERDLLGALYEYLLPEGEKNFSGAYYTPGKTAEEIMKKCPLAKDGLFLDPCCGSGSFFLPDIFQDPEQIRGCDSDFHAVFAAKINLLCKFPDFCFVPRIFHCDFLTGKAGENENASCVKELFETAFDLIAANPPWGGMTALLPRRAPFRETFSAFFVKSFPLLKEGGECVFLFPGSILKIARHENIRKYILENCAVKEIVLPQKPLFAGVMTRQVIFRTGKGPLQDVIPARKAGEKCSCSRKEVLKRKNSVFSFFDQETCAILRRIRSGKRQTLAQSIFAMGIVTGDNRNKVKKEEAPGLEKVYTGKEIFPFFLAEAKNFLPYERSSLQQVAREEYYRAKEKLVYRFISDRLVFALDDTKSLFLNSANLLIPKVENMGMKSLLALLNSHVLNFYYAFTFDDPKILKKNLLLLPLPFLTKEEDLLLAQWTEKLLKGDRSPEEALQRKIAEIYGLTEEEYAYIVKALSLRKKKKALFPGKNLQ